jgi:hypothetical protein
MIMMVSMGRMLKKSSSVQHQRPESRFLGPLQKVPLYHVLWSFQQQLGALKRVGSRFPFRLVAFRRILALQAGVKMAEPRNRKLAQPFTILDLAGDQDNFLAFGVAGFCHGCLRLEQGVEKSRQQPQLMWCEKSLISLVYSVCLVSLG